MGTFYTYLLGHILDDNHVGEYARVFAHRKAFPRDAGDEPEPYLAYTEDIADAMGRRKKDFHTLLFQNAWNRWKVHLLETA